MKSVGKEMTVMVEHRIQAVKEGWVMDNVKVKWLEAPGVKELCGSVLEELNRTEKEAKSRIPETDLWKVYPSGYDRVQGMTRVDH